MKVNPVVFFVSGGLIVLFLIAGAFFPQEMDSLFAGLLAFITGRLGWLYIVSVALFLGFSLRLLFGPYGKVRLGADDEKPVYSRTSWFAMLFSAGMGIGLMFFSVAEPVMHFSAPPNGEPGTVAAARQAMRLTFFHWGLHAWGTYIVVGLAMAYFSYRHGLPLTIRSTLYPLLGERIHGPIGNAVEIMAVFGTLFGVATSLGLGVQQIGAGLEHLGLFANTQPNQFMLIAAITIIATASVVSGLDRGIRRLSEFNLALGLILLVFVFIAGPTGFLVSSIAESVGDYVIHLPAMTFPRDTFAGGEWQQAWTLFYWGWWIAWSPFVGMFIARISRGRTIREFVLGVLFAPVLLTFLWLSVFGHTALHMELSGTEEIALAVQQNLPTALFVMLEGLPWAEMTCTLGIVVTATYFVTSSDSASLVIDILTAGGDPDPPIAQRVFWALTEGAAAAILLYAGGLRGLQTAAITTALPFCIVMLFICFSLIKGLQSERGRPAAGDHRDASDVPGQSIDCSDEESLI